MLRWTLLFITALAAAAAGCGSAESDGSAARQADGFTLRVLPESFAFGGAGDIALQTAEASSDSVVAQVSVANADALKALYVEIDYDPAQWTPVAADGRLGELAGAPDIELHLLDRPGTVASGQVLQQPQARAGLSGASALVAELRFVRQPFVGAQRSAADAPVSLASRAQLSYIDTPPALSWGYASAGDYDQNRETNIADLTPIGVHFGTGGGPFDPASVQSVVDGDGNGEINIADLTPIGANYGRRISRYDIYRSAEPGDYPPLPGSPDAVAPFASVDYGAAAGSRTTGRLSFVFPLDFEPGLRYWVRPADGDHRGTPSTPYDHPLPVNNPPVILSAALDPDSVVSGGSATITMDASDPDGDPLTYEYLLSEGSIAGSGPSVTLTAPVTGTDTLVVINCVVRDDQGAQDTAQLQLSVTAPANQPPSIDALVSDLTTLDSFATAQLSATATDPDGDPLSYSWSADFGALTEADDTAQLELPGFAVETTVTVALTVDDGRGGTDSASLPLTVRADDAVTEVNVSFVPGAISGIGTPTSTYKLANNATYSFFATDQYGRDITEECAFTDRPVPITNPHSGTWDANRFTTNNLAFGDLKIILIYHDGLPDEVRSDPDRPGAEMYFTVVSAPPI